MENINEEIKKLCASFDGYLHFSGSAQNVEWHAMQCRFIGEFSSRITQMKSAAGHPSAEKAIEECLKQEWRLSR